MRTIARSAAGAAIFCAAFLFACAPAHLRAQAPPDIQKLAGRAAQRILRAGATHVLAVPMSGCILDHQACSAFDQSLGDMLNQKIAGLDWIQYDRLAEALLRNHFLEIDGFYQEALNAVAADAGAQILVTSDPIWEGSRYSLHIAIVDAATRVELEHFSAPLRDSQPGPNGLPYLPKDPATGAAFILWNNDHRNAPLFKRPVCQVCNQPTISVDALARHLGGSVRLLATVTGSGTLADVVVARSLDPLLDDQALKAARGYLFKPALDADGLPFAARIQIDVKFPMGY